MVLSVANYKGGVGKTTTAMHLAAFMADDGPTALVDSDATRTATKWAQRSGTRLPFSIIPASHLAREARHNKHIIIDQEANPDAADFAELAGGCDLMIVPCTPSEPAADGLAHTLERIHHAGASYRVLLTIVPPAPSRMGAMMREKLEVLGLPLFRTAIPRLAVFEHLAGQGLTATLGTPEQTESPESRAYRAYRDVWEEVLFWPSLPR